MNIALVIQIVTAAMQLAPLGVSTVKEIKGMLASDPAVPPDLAKLLRETAADNAATLAAVNKWLAEHPE